MLAKVKTGTVSCRNCIDVVDETLKTIGGSTTNYSFETVFNNTYGNDVNVVLTITAFGKAMSNDTSCNVNYYYRKGTSGDGTRKTPQWMRSNNSEMPYNGDNNNTAYDKDIILTENNLSNGDVMQIRPNGRNSYLYQRKKVASVTYNYNVPAPTVNIKGVPRELKQITQNASTTIFGVHTDRTRVTQDQE